MNYLTNYYKNLCEQLEQKLNVLNRMLNEWSPSQLDAQERGIPLNPCDSDFPPADCGKNRAKYDQQHREAQARYKKDVQAAGGVEAYERKRKEERNARNKDLFKEVMNLKDLSVEPSIPTKTNTPDYNFSKIKPKPYNPYSERMGEDESSPVNYKKENRPNVPTNITPIDRRKYIQKKF